MKKRWCDKQSKKKESGLVIVGDLVSLTYNDGIHVTRQILRDSLMADYKLCSFMVPESILIMIPTFFERENQGPALIEQGIKEDIYLVTHIRG